MDLMFLGLKEWTGILQAPHCHFLPIFLSSSFLTESPQRPAPISWATAYHHFQIATFTPIMTFSITYSFSTLSTCFFCHILNLIRTLATSIQCPQISSPILITTLCLSSSLLIDFNSTSTQPGPCLPHVVPLFPNQPKIFSLFLNDSSAHTHSVLFPFFLSL